jgi:hypothetical protein
MNAAMIAEIRDLFGVLIIDDLLFRVKINMTIEEVVYTIRDKFDVEKIHTEMMAIINCWRRTKSWYTEDYVSKFERCLEEVVVDEMRGFLKGFLETRKKELEDEITLNESDLFDAVKSASQYLLSRDWESDTKLTDCAIWWAQYYGDRILQCDYEHTALWFNKKTEETSYSSPQVCESANDDVDLQPLFHYIYYLPC